MSFRSSVSNRVVGGKAAALLELERAGFRIPETYVSPENLETVVTRLGAPIAVRSSATVEDGGYASFAGQFESVLNLQTLEEVEEAVRKVQESVSAASVVEYCRKNGIDPAGVQMGVIVQRMIRPELAGVAFTVNPVTGEDEVVIEACEGLADELLQGRKPALPADHPLVRQHRPEIERVARQIQRHFGAPQDVEFAIEGGVLFVVQARPITRIGFRSEVGEWTNADFRDGGVSSGVCTPLMGSLYDFIWKDSLKEYFRELRLLDDDFQAGRMFFGRPYWNLGAVKRCFAKLPGFVEREFDKDLSVQVTYEGDGIRTPVTLWRILKAIPTVRALHRLYRTQEEFDRAFLAGGFDEIEREYEDLSGDVEERFRRLIQEAYQRTENQYFRTIYLASFAKMEFLDSFPDANYTKLVAGLPEMKHLEPTKVLREMAARGDTDVTLLQRRFRYHSRHELDIRAPRWDEDREWVEGLLRQYRDAGSAGSDPRPAYEKARAEYERRLSWYKRGSFRDKLDRLRKFVWLREEMRDCSSRMYWLIRRYVLDIARRRRMGDDIFFMTLEEIFQNDRRNVEHARELYEGYRNFKAPNEIGSRFVFAPAKKEGALRGIGASQGKVRGVARVARSVEEAVRAEKGAVLICPFTDPGWTPVLDRVAAVVTETGGLLSHAAVICREYGIPAVLNVANATERIPEGALVTVDGGEGTVEVERG